MTPLERTILRELFADGSFAEAVCPYLKEEYFHSTEAAHIYRLYTAFYEKFRTIPQVAAIRIGLDSVPSLNEREAAAAQTALAEVAAEQALDSTQRPWLMEQTEEFCQERAVYCALQKAIQVMDDPKATRNTIPDLLKDALAVSFDQHVGHDFFEDAEARYEFYHKPEVRIPFDLDTLNKMTKGGVPKKTLNVVMAGTNVGKSLFLVHVAAAALRFSKRVLYITLEMAEERIAERIDANMMNIPLDDLELMPRDMYLKKLKHLASTSTGKLIIKEYPTAAAHAGHFRALIQELRMKRDFVPDLLIVDYLSICSSSRIKMGATINSYTLYKFVAEELRGLGVEFEIPVFTAAQFNREGFESSDPSITNVGESWGIPQTADFMFALVQNAEMEKLGQLAIQPMKNRYRKKNTYQQELIGLDTDRMKLYDLTPAQIAAATASPPANTAQSAAPATPSLSTFSQRRRRPLQQLKKDAESASE